jgi:hypothetical protein
VGAISANDLDGSARVFGYFGQVEQLAAHYLGAADGAMQDAFVED